jgi:Tfp pilus assembly pilus retraction ATPase PilT
MSLDFADLLLEVIEHNASDLHLTAGAIPPCVCGDACKRWTATPS